MMDIETPQMNGVDATKVARNELGLNDYITKPFEQDAFYQVIGKYLTHEEREVSLVDKAEQGDSTQEQLQLPLLKVTDFAAEELLEQATGQVERLIKTLV